MRRIAVATGVSRSALTAALRAPTRKRACRRADSDGPMVERIRPLVAERPTYGYRRITALLNRGKAPEERVNHKRIYRLMRTQQWLLERHTARPVRAHDGKVSTLASNLRWCSDSFEIRCWSGERVFVTVALDCCDREVLAYHASTIHPTSETICDLMAESLEARFGPGTTRTPRRIEWLSDNGAPYTAHRTRAFGLQAGFLVVTTPAYSPESNGLAEAFVKGFKRDYVYLARLSNAENVLRDLPAWVQDYNEHRPHRALGMRSPREFLRAREAA